LDKVLDELQGLRGVVFVTSYRYGHDIKNTSKYSPEMLVSGDKDDIKKFSRGETPQRILVSPVAYEGVDMPDGACRFVIFSKLPVPNLIDPVLKARATKDRRLVDSLTQLRIEQGIGRGLRNSKDWCVCIIFDKAWAAFFRRTGRKSWPKHVRTSYKTVDHPTAIGQHVKECTR
jgi:Rad3-related DNA helicase